MLGEHSGSCLLACMRNERTMHYTYVQQKAPSCHGPVSVDIHAYGLLTLRTAYDVMHGPHIVHDVSQHAVDLAAGWVERCTPQQQHVCTLHAGLPMGYGEAELVKVLDCRGKMKHESGMNIDVRPRM